MKLRLSSKCALAMGLVILTCAAFASAARADGWYRPDQADFRPIYERDLANRRAESWDGEHGYWA